MFIEILVIILIILVVLFILLFFNSWNVHLIFKNDNLHHNFYVTIDFLLFQLVFSWDKSIRKITLNLSFKSKILKVYDFNFNKNNSVENEETDVERIILSKLRKSYPLLSESKEELFIIINLLINIIHFEDSYAVINLGFGDNNLTIKFCSLLWALTAPLYPLQFSLYLTPEINKTIFKSDIKINLALKLFNTLKIVYIVLSTQKLRKVIQIFLNR